MTEFEEELKSTPLPTYSREIKLTPAIGDWTMLRPAPPRQKEIKSGLRGFDRFSEEDLILIHTIHYNFATTLTNLLKSRLQTGVQLYSIKIEQFTYGDFISSLHSPIIQAKINLPSFEQEASLILDLSLADSLINRVLGSKDTPLGRKLTMIEETILTDVLKETLPSLSSAWKNISSNPTLTALHSPDFVPDSIISPDDTFVVLSSKIIVAKSDPHKIIIGYQQSLLKALLQKLKPILAQTPFKPEKLPSSLLEEIKIPLTVTLGSSTINTRDLKDLRPGDVVSLENTLTDPVSILLANKVQLLGQIGIEEDRLSTQILRVKTPEVERAFPKVVVETPPPKEEEPKIEEPEIPEETPEETPELPEEEVGVDLSRSREETPLEEEISEPAEEAVSEEEEKTPEEEFDFDLEDLGEEGKEEA